MTRDEAYALLKENLHNKNLIKHCLAVEAVMRKLADYFSEDEKNGDWLAYYMTSTMTRRPVNRKSIASWEERCWRK